MKQVTITDLILQRLTAAGADPANIAVYEASALSTRPVRKQHPLYLGARHTRNFLQEMAAALSAESLPLQIMHDGSELPLGRIFHGEVLDNDMGGSELRVQFWVDVVHADKIELINHGTVDQVSVSVMGKSAKCSVCNFDYFGEKATLDNIWEGTCDKGHVIGVDGVHVVINELDRWNEMSLVNSGGAVGARIMAHAEQRLAANGAASHMLTLTLSDKPETSTMDMTQLIEKLTNAQAQVITLTASATTKDAELAALNVKIVELQTQLADAVAKEAAALAAKGDHDALVAALTDATQHILALKGDATTKVEGAPAAIAELLKASTKDMKLVSAAVVPAPGKVLTADAGNGFAALRAPNSTSPYKRATR